MSETPLCNRFEHRRTGIAPVLHRLEACATGLGGGVVHRLEACATGLAGTPLLRASAISESFKCEIELPARAGGHCAADDLPTSPQAGIPPSAVRSCVVVTVDRAAQSAQRYSPQAASEFARESRKRQDRSRPEACPRRASAIPT